MAVLASLIANIHRDPKKRGVVSPAEFMYTDSQTAQENADLEMVARFEARADGS